METAVYQLKPSNRKIIVSKLLNLVLLGALLYGGIILNVDLLNINLPVATHFIIVNVLLLLFIIELVLVHKKRAGDFYQFFNDRVQIRDKVVYFTNVQNISYKRSFLDKLVNTGTIVLEPGFEIKDIIYDNQIYVYVQNLVKYAQGQKT